ncbi:MAG: hypothetical protein NUV57_00945 [archaeon]|nr:hypothetical protein [archaeon]
MKKEKGQIFSIDFLIAMVLAVLAIGLLLNAYELSVYEIKEAKTRNELTVIAMNAGNIFIGTNQCGLDPSNPSGPPPKDPFKDQGYEINGCFDSTPGVFDLLNKSKLMIPDVISCSVEYSGKKVNGCDVGNPAPSANVVVIERVFLATQNKIAKADYENCIDSVSTCSTYSNNTLTVKVWK